MTLGVSHSHPCVEAFDAASHAPEVTDTMKIGTQMDFLSQIVPAAVILLANLLGGPQSSNRWEFVTAFFGWSAAAALVVLLVASVGWPRTVLKE